MYNCNKRPVDLTRSALDTPQVSFLDTAQQQECGFAWEHGMFVVFTGHELEVAPSQPLEGKRYDLRLFAGILAPPNTPTLTDSLAVPARGSIGMNTYWVIKHARLLYTKLFMRNDWDPPFTVGEGVALGPRGCVVPVAAHAPIAIGRVLGLPSETDPYLVISCVQAWG